MVYLIFYGILFIIFCGIFKCSTYSVAYKNIPSLQTIESTFVPQGLLSLCIK